MNHQPKRVERKHNGKEAKEKICQSIDSKKALEKLNELRKITQK